MPDARRRQDVGLLTRLRWTLKSPQDRLHVAEQRFFDAYCRGGQLAHRELVVPLDYFVRQPVKEVLLAWLVAGEPLGLERLAETWKGDKRRVDLTPFYENLVQFLAILHNGDAYDVTWRGPDGEFFGYGSELFD